MQNYVQKGENITLAAPYDVLSGAGALVGSLFGVAITGALSGVDTEFATTGVFDLKCLGTDVPAQGAKVYWDNTAKQCTTTAGGNSLIGAATVTKTNGPTVVRVRLNGITI